MSSLGGERLERAALTAAGIEGDRTHGVFHAESGEIAYPGRDRRWAALPRALSRLRADGALEVSTDGSIWGDPAGPRQAAALSAFLGFPARVRRYAGEGPRPRYNRAPIHLLTTSALRTLQTILPDSVIDARRFRPNILVDTPEELDGIPEYALRGRRFRIGGVTLRGTIPCARCAFTTLAQPGLPEDREVFRALLHRFGRDLGLYCEVEGAGSLRHGDAVLQPEPAPA
ncbi:MOSC domain-containing protein [Roseomonas nepalensis]|uniref:MOSC domain-containing protein n=1 Tax=Muricoccus nepalensis TaxID=1854500 RepID=A0A502GHT9_9PROT|nr:MOSC domain-containing protein [Roseomonas nepalensis]